jgi:hypothetical protein
MPSVSRPAFRMPLHSERGGRNRSRPHPETPLRRTSATKSVRICRLYRAYAQLLHLQVQTNSTSQQADAKGQERNLGLAQGCTHSTLGVCTDFSVATNCRISTDPASSRPSSATVRPTTTASRRRASAGTSQEQALHVGEEWSNQGGQQHDIDRSTSLRRHASGYFDCAFAGRSCAEHYAGGRFDAIPERPHIRWQK